MSPIRSPPSYGILDVCYNVKSTDHKHGNRPSHQYPGKAYSPRERVGHTTQKCDTQTFFELGLGANVSISSGGMQFLAAASMHKEDEAVAAKAKEIKAKFIPPELVCQASLISAT